MNNINEDKKKEIADKIQEMLNDPIWNNIKPDKENKENKENKEEKPNDILLVIAYWMTVLFFPAWLFICSNFFSNVNVETMRMAEYFCFGIIIGFDICAFIASVKESIENDKLNELKKLEKTHEVEVEFESKLKDLDKIIEFDSKLEDLEKTHGVEFESKLKDLKKTIDFEFADKYIDIIKLTGLTLNDF